MIIQLVGEKEVMKRKETELTNKIRYLEQRVRELDEEKKADDLNVHEEVLYDNLCEETHELHITDQSNCGNGTYRHVSAKPHITDQSNHGTRLNIPPSARQPLHIKNQSKIFEHLEEEEQSHMTRMQPLVDFSLSPLKFTDTSSSSGLCVLENALQLVDDGSVELPQSTPVKGSVPENGKENHVTHPLIVEGSQVTQILRGGMKGRSQGGYKGPPARQSRRPKIRNYNIKD